MSDEGTVPMTFGGVMVQVPASLYQQSLELHDPLVLAWGQPKGCQ
jgi:hypothetical protein